MVCGVNEYVSGPDKSDTPVEDDRYHHTHANFLVTRNVGSVCSGPVLFFAELSNDEAEDGGGKVLCCPVSFPQPRQGILYFFIQQVD